MRFLVSIEMSFGSKTRKIVTPSPKTK